MGNAKNIAGVHRFRDELAISACDHEDGATVYLSLKQARQLRAAIGKIVRSIERDEFAKSESGLSLTLDVRDRRFTHGERIERRGVQS